MQLAHADFCAIDIETTGLNPGKDEILSFAGIPIRGAKIIVHDSYYTLIHSENYRLEA
jgi:DNA polymerase III epsilon subunit-like protein